jgi:hypothetical protein
MLEELKSKVAKHKLLQQEMDYKARNLYKELVANSWVPYRNGSKLVSPILEDKSNTSGLKITDLEEEEIYEDDFIYFDFQYKF